MMRALLDQNKLNLAAEGEFVALWRPSSVDHGEARELVAKQMQPLLKTLVAASTDQTAVLLPADERARERATMSLLPWGCALAAAIPGFFLGGVIFAVMAFQKLIPNGFFPIFVIGTMFLVGLLGWIGGVVIQRLVHRRG
jgi:hypothetical protein